jgi:hypothetical protein
MNGFGRFLVLGIVAVIVLSNLSFAETTCTVKECEIEIKIKIAFQGASADYITRATNEIQDTWNGPTGSRTTGDCKCKMTFKVETTTAQDCKNNPPAGYHCVMVTDYNNDPPRNQTNWTGATFYIGYMYGISTGSGGNSEKGWWSDIMSRPVNANQPQGEHYKDFAHEAGHMMGLEDGDGGIMSSTSGNDSDPTQANIDEIANDICGPNPCPDRCCCGNGAIDDNVNEQCDPMAQPTGCAQGQACCVVCCNCFGPICIPANGEYLSQTDCSAACGTGNACYYNYKTGCWDCVKQEVMTTETCYDSVGIRGREECDHQPMSFILQGKSLYDNDLVATPFLGDVFSDERINIKTEEGEVGHLVTNDAVVSAYGDTLLGDPSVTMMTNSETIGLIASEHMNVQQAMSEGRIEIQGEGFFGGIKFGVYHFLFDVYNLFSPAPEFVPPAEDEEQLPAEYYDYLGDIVYAEPAPDDPDPTDIGETPDDGYFGEDVFPS